MQTITRDDIKKLIDEQANIALVEALPKKEFAAGHLPGALSIPLETIRKAAPELLRDKQQQIIGQLQAQLQQAMQAPNPTADQQQQIVAKQTELQLLMQVAQQGRGVLAGSVSTGGYTAQGLGLTG